MCNFSACNTETELAEKYMTELDLLISSIIDEGLPLAVQLTTLADRAESYVNLTRAAAKRAFELEQSQ